jgi:hypothetical protein
MLRRGESKHDHDPNIPRPAELVKVSVTLLLDPYVITGTVHLPPEVARFSDAWETVLADPRIFIPVTDATISSQSGNIERHTPFIHVRKAEVKAAFPGDGPGPR